MKILIDSANVDDIKYLIKYYPIDGVTTNPSILLKEHKDPIDVISCIRNTIGDLDLHVQAVSKNSDDIIEESKLIANKFGKKTIIKIPAIEEGIRAIKVLSDEGYRITATAIYSLEQAFLSANSGAEFVAPYVNRMEKFYGNGIDTVKRINNTFKNNSLNTKILAASFKKVEQVMALAEIGVYSATVPVDVLKSFLVNKDVDDAVDKFISDLKKLCGKEKEWIHG